MYYSITVKLPKSKIQQYDMPGPVSVNDLLDAEFTALLSSFVSHSILSNKLSELKSGLKEVFWETLSPQKLNLFINFYSSDPVYFADVNTQPGENGTVHQKDGNTILNNSKVPQLKYSNQAYISLEVNPIPYARYKNKNFFIPNYEINPLYKVAIQNPDPATFDLILNDLIEKNILPFPLGDKKYREKPILYLYNNVWYKMPDYNTLKKDDAFFQVFKKYVTVEPIKIFTENINAWIDFLQSLPPKAHTVYTYDSYISTDLPKQFSPFKGTQGKKIPVYEYEKEFYYVPAYETFNNNEELKKLWHEIIILNRPISYSKADEAFRQLEVQYPFQELNDYGLTFEQQFNCKEDPRWNKFINEKYLKIPENATEEEIKKEIRTRSPKLFLFSSIKPIKVEVIDKDGKKKHCFNLSNDYFENIPDGPWKRCMSALSNNPCKIYEFAIWCDSLNPEVWKGESRTPTEKGDIKLTPFTFLHDRGMDESAYSIDAVLLDDYKRIQYIIEFDGSDHFYSRGSGNPTGKIVSDQMKNCFAREHNIPCIRIPGFRNKRRGPFISDFKKYVTNLIRQSYGFPPIQQESETVNPAVYNNNKSPD